LGGRVVGMPVLLLTTTGRRSGQPHTTALTYLPDGRNLVVVASNGGAPKDPDWMLNLRTNSRAVIQMRDVRLAVRSREVAGAKRTELWNRVVQKYSGYAAYQSRTSRTIPVVILEPEPDGGSELKSSSVALI